MKKPFGDWLLETMREKGITAAKLSRTTGMDSGVVSNLINGKRNAGTETCRQIAYALHVPIEEVYRAAGLLPPDPTENPVVESIATLAARLPHEDKVEVLEYARHRLQLFEHKRNNGAATRGHVPT